MTGHLSLDNQGYCAIWTEVLAGRAGDDIASAAITILDKVLEDNPEISNLVIWRDSCAAKSKSNDMLFNASFDQNS